MDKVRRGGFVVFITSPDTMSSYDSQKLRNALNEKANLIAAFKLPNTTFEKNAAPKTLADILILQKRENTNKLSEYAQNWLGDGKIDVMDIDGKGIDVAKELSALIDKFSENIFKSSQTQRKTSLQNMDKRQGWYLFWKNY